ncbi:toxin-antitoxin system YwqK family antitoxin [Winogradskyella sp. PG-2]|uniref:toxin-antitoxin system YwqK family antitoxin n=1 Tax=Winogradskyella sp. PG-2 TaxID=754409 RepID=UPI0004587F1E|nr:hypothetical protein [Winogradskyella sp. PG-2]BAO76806.1 phophatidylinositol-4-phosphate 5-kinase [Winogradskyella sp. PG-2]
MVLLKKKAYYSDNKLHGLKTNYFENGDIVSEFNYVNGKSHGIQKTWYKNGQLAKKKNLNNNIEEGFQQAWLENGELYVNYEAKNGRIFGMRLATSCYSLENETLIKTN